jgi:DNA-binding NarL/FixJ family response regulator
VSRALDVVGGARVDVRVQLADRGLRVEVMRRLHEAGLAAAQESGRPAASRDGVIVCDAARLTRGTGRSRPARCVAVVPGRDRDEARRAFAAGAAGVVFADELSALPSTVAAVGQGQLVVPGVLRTAIVKPVLTTREKQILALVVLGLSNREIADQLFVAESTVKSHLFSAFRRLGVRTRKEATALILDGEQGLGSGILAITR